jgi:hypothetical protein
MAQTPSNERNVSGTLWSVVFAACLLLAAAHLASVTRDQMQQETTLIEDTFTQSPDGR